MDSHAAASEDGNARIARMAARLFGVPVAFVTLPDGVAARLGLADEDMAAAIAFGHAVLQQDGVLAWSDAGAPRLRFLVGVPLSVDGVTVGSLCVADQAVREFGEAERTLLRDLAAMAQAALGALVQARAAERRRAFFKTAAHELRTPMASIVGFSELLLKREFDAATSRELLGIIHTQSTHMVARVNQMLDLARVDAGGPDEDRRASVSLSRLAADAVAATLPSARAADLATTEAPGLPVVRANADRLQQALSAILANALRFSAPGSPIALALAPATRDGRPGASLAVHDHGIGMTPEQRARMFEAFYCAGEHPELEGVGLGLALARAIVSAHGGAIEAASRPGAGTTVTVWIPAARDA